MTLVIDLDETLVLATKTRLCPEQLAVDVSIQGKLSTFYVAKRPFAEVFLAELFPLFQIVIFTAGRHEYANALLDSLDLHAYVDRCLTREDCRLVGPNLYAKDLQKVCSDLSKTVLIDDSPVAALYFPDNYVPIEGWCGNETDTALMDLLPLLLALRSVRDVRAILHLRHRGQPEQRRTLWRSGDSPPSPSPNGFLRFRSPSLVELTPSGGLSTSAALSPSPLAQQPPTLSASVLAACRSTMRAGFVSGVYAPLQHVQVSIHQRVRYLAQGVQECVYQNCLSVDKTEEREKKEERRASEDRNREEEANEVKALARRKKKAKGEESG